MKYLVLALGLVAVLAAPASAQQLVLQIADGRVTLDATNVPARQILAEWAKIGGTTVVGAEKIAGAPLTLKLTDVPERQALDIILRNVAGFIAAPRQASAMPGASSYDRILVMATSTVVPSQPAPRAAGRIPGQMDGTQRRVPPRPPNLPPSFGDAPPAEDQQELQQEVHDDQVDAEPPVFTFPNPNGAPVDAPVFVPMENGQQPGQAPVITLQPGQSGPTIYNFVPNGQQTPGVTTSPTFGVIGAPAPGMIVMPPQPQQPGQPVPPQTRPPGQ